ncbi:MAG TPA: hypothetical protein VMF10_07085 [Candidatus Aquilonibacter sp.]|nr:hypothetical protein [Candidatus Aquilonibacter sp.]
MVILLNGCRTAVSRKSFSRLQSRLAALLSITAVLLLFPGYLAADTAAFDLPGPRIEVKVARSGKTLPISEVPNLKAADRLWLHPIVPNGQSVHYLLVAAFLRGSTNPPPEPWFTRVETWNNKVRQEGVYVTVPQGAEQALLFLAPETGGDFSTVRSAVRNKPGAFVRASQDLNQAALDRSRLDKYLEGVRALSDVDPKTLQGRTLMLARSLKIKVDKDCFDKPVQEQASCLTEKTDQLVLDDGHSQSMVDALTSGPASDLVGNLSNAKLAGGGAYSPYVGALVDVAKMMESFHVAQYQYIPALALPKDGGLDLKLNNVPSFHKPMSVLVIALPAVEAAQLPPLRPIDPKRVSCLQQSTLVLPVDGAPLVFSTQYAHDMDLHVESKAGMAIDLPVRADPGQGGIVVDTKPLHVDKTVDEVSGTIHGLWGFDSFTGPAFQLQFSHPVKWILASADSTALIVGREDSIHLQSEEAPCVEQVSIKDVKGKQVKATWKLLKADEVEVNVPLKGETSGPVLVLVAQSGQPKPDEVPMQTYSEAAHLDHFALNAGDKQGTLTGTRLDEVAGLKLDKVEFSPAGLKRAGGKDELKVLAPGSSSTAAFEAGQSLVAHVTLKDGRVLDLDTTIDPPRPRVTLLSKSIQAGPVPSLIHLGNQDDLPQDGQMSFFLKTEIPVSFPRDEKIEIATDDDSTAATFSLEKGTLFLEDPQTVLITLQPLKSFGPSVFGQLRYRAISGSGQHGDWQPLVKLVRIPTLKEVRCPDSPDKACTLVGQDLFLLDSVASDPQFLHSIPVPASFVDSGLTVPRPNGTLLYIKLRDDPSIVNKAALPVMPEPS